MSENNQGWESWSNHVIETMKELKRKQDESDKKISDMNTHFEVEITTLRVRLGTYIAIVGVLVSLLTSIIVSYVNNKINTPITQPYSQHSTKEEPLYVPSNKDDYNKLLNKLKRDMDEDITKNDFPY